jgi:hypothetical protein
LRVGHERVVALSDQHVDPKAGLVPLEADRLRPQWQDYRTKHPGEFVHSDQEVLAWHRRQAEEAEQAGQWFAAVWHLDRLIDPKAPDWRLYYWRGVAYNQMGQWSRGAEDLTQATGLKADDWRAWARLAQARLNLRQRHKAADWSQGRLARFCLIHSAARSMR